MRKHLALLAGILSSFTAAGGFLDVGRYPKLKGSDLSRMRRDVSRLGSDFAAVIEREHGRAGTIVPAGTTARRPQPGP